MKELSVVEMNEVSGAYWWDFSSLQSTVASVVSNIGEAAVSATLAAAVGGMAGAVIGGKHGGDGGGLLGFGAIGQGVGMLAGGAMGMLGGGVAAITVGWDTTLEYSTKTIDGIINGTF